MWIKTQDSPVSRQFIDVKKAEAALELIQLQLVSCFLLRLDMGRETFKQAKESGLTHLPADSYYPRRVRRDNTFGSVVGRRPRYLATANWVEERADLDRILDLGRKKNRYPGILYAPREQSMTPQK